MACSYKPKTINIDKGSSIHRAFIYTPLIIKSEFIIIILSFLLLLHSVSFAIYDYPFDQPTQHLKEIHTSNFIIVYSDNSSQHAYSLATYVEDELQELIDNHYGEFDLIEHIPNQKIRVIVSSDIQMANGFASLFLYPTIHLYANNPPLSSDSHSYANGDYLRSMFRHELTHIVTIAIRQYFPDSPFPNYINHLVTPSAIFASRSFLEGSAIARESDYGYGRLNDPYTYHLMRRDLLDDKLLTFAKFGGANTSYGTGAYAYTYGALFNQYLQQNHQDLEFWEGVGNWKVSSWALKDMTQTKQKDIWHNFVDSLKVTNNYKINTNNLLSHSDKRIHSIQYINDKIYYYNARNKELRAYDLQTQKDRLVLFGKSTWDKVSVSSDERFLLISGYANNKNFVSIIKNSPIYSHIRTYRGLDDASFLSEGVSFVAINRNTPYPELVIVDGNDMQTLYRGAYQNYFDSPIVSGNYIYFIHQFNDKRLLSRMNITTRRISYIDRLQHIRFITKDPQGISISYADSSTDFYKRAIIRGNTLLLVRDNIKGEIFDSIVYQNNLYYKSSFSSEDNLMQIPLNELTTTQHSISFTPLPNVENIEHSYKGEVFGYNTSRDLFPMYFIPYASTTKAGFGLLLQDSIGANLIHTGLNIEYENITPEFFMTWKNEEPDITYTTTICNLYRSSSYVLQLQEHHLLYIGFGGSYTKTIPQGSLFYVSLDLSWLGGFTGEGHPYTWNTLDSQQLIGSTSFAWQLYTYEGQFGYQRYIDLLVRYNIDFVNSQYYRTEGRIRFSPPVLPITVRLFGAYDSSSLTIWGVSLLGTSIIPTYEEYSDYYIANQFVVYGDIDMMIYSWEIQNGLGFGEFFVERWAFFGGYRAGYWDIFLQSVYLNTQFDFSILYGNLPISISAEVNYAITSNQWNYKIGLNTTLPI